MRGWPGLNHFFEPSREILLATSADSVLMALAWPCDRRAALGTAARRRVLSEHTGDARARTFARDLDWLAQRRSAAGAERFRPLQEPATGRDVPGEDRFVVFEPQGTKGVRP